MFKVDEDEYLAHRTPAHMETLRKAYRYLEKRYEKLNAVGQTAPTNS